MKELSNCEQALSLLLFTFGRLGVPMFFFISGYLLLGFEYDERKTRRFYSKNLLGLVVATEIWFLIYQIYNSVFYHKQFLLGECIKTALFMTQTPMTHTWYMPVIIGIYMMIPAVSNALCHANKLFLIPLVFSFIAVFVIPEVNVVMRLRGLPEFSSFLDLNFAGGGIRFLRTAWIHTEEAHWQFQKNSADYLAPNPVFYDVYNSLASMVFLSLRRCIQCLV